MSKLTALVVFVAMSAAACGSSSKGAATGGTAAVTAGSAQGSGGGRFCDLARRDRAAFSAAGIAATTPERLRVLYGNLGVALDQARAAAPAAIKGDFATFITAYRPFLRDLAAANYDFRRLRRAALLPLHEARAASLRIQQYMRQVCKIALTPTT